MQSKKPQLFDVLSPGQTFFFGIIAGIMTLCTIGFFVLLGMVMKGDTLAIGNGGGNNRVAAAPTAAPTAPGAPTPSRPVSIEVDEKNDNILGDKDAKVTIVEFSDADCPFCSRFHPTMKQVLEDYDGDVRWVFRHFPLESIHPNARTLSIAAECAGLQGKFWEYNDAIYERQGQFRTTDAMKALAAELKLNQGKFDSCLDNKETDSVVQKHMSQATAAGCSGTPCSIVIDEDGNTTPINGAFPLERVKSIIDPLVN